MSIVDDRPFEVIAVEEILEMLRAGVARAVNSLAKAVAFDEDKALDRRYDWGWVSFEKDSDTERLNSYYLDGAARDINELALMAIRGCSIEIESAKGLMSELSVTLDRLGQPNGYSKDMLGGVRAALKCVARLNVWVGRVDFSARAKKVHFHERKISEINSVKGAKRNAGAADYKEEIFDVIFKCLASGAQYDRWEDIVTNPDNQALFDLVNEDFSRFSSKVQLVEVVNLPEKIKSWSRGISKVRENLDRVKAVLERRNKKK